MAKQDFPYTPERGMASMTPSEAYQYKIYTKDENFYFQYNGDGTENPFPDVDPNDVTSIMFLPKDSPRIPSHILTFDDEVKFVRRFGRGIITPGSKEREGITEYLQCVVTTAYRFYLYSDGRVAITNKNYELKKVL